MDIDHVRYRLAHRCTGDVETVADIVSELVDLVGTIDDLVARQRIRIEVLESQVNALELGRVACE